MIFSLSLSLSSFISSLIFFSFFTPSFFCDSLRLFSFIFQTVRNEYRDDVERTSAYVKKKKTGRYIVVYYRVGCRMISRVIRARDGAEISLQTE